jgi:hypothetical protein
MDAAKLNGLIVDKSTIDANVSAKITRIELAGPE